MAKQNIEKIRTLSLVSILLSSLQPTTHKYVYNLTEPDPENCKIVNCSLEEVSKICPQTCKYGIGK